MQEELAIANKVAWETKAYQAWVHKYGTPDELAFARAWMNTYNLKQPTGNYFDNSIKEGEVAFAKLLPEEERSGLGKTLVRSWTVGEILTAIGTMGLFIRTFEEIPSSTDPRFPEFYTLIADNIDMELSPLHP